jgi:hypothetical protein
LLKPTRDIDTVADLKALMTEYGLSAGAPARGVGALSKRTEGALRLLAGRYPELKKHNPVSWGDS